MLLTIFLLLSAIAFGLVAFQSFVDLFVDGGIRHAEFGDGSLGIAVILMFLIAVYLLFTQGLFHISINIHYS